MLYARAALNAKGTVRFGLRHIRGYPYPLYYSNVNSLDVFNRKPYKAKDCPRQGGIPLDFHKEHDSEDLSDQNHVGPIHVMMYIFPREFGLHNVFTSIVDPCETVQPFKDYTMREDEIASMFGLYGAKQKVPRRLRGKAIELVEKLRILHSRCPYTELLKHYCPLSVGIMTSNFCCC
jgi:telomerase reverse transcriptase